MARKTPIVNIIAPDTNKLEIRSTTNAKGQQVVVGEDVLMGILLTLGQMKQILEEIREIMEWDEEEEVD